jgi:2,4-dienoyl-CoA reductase (NADPH2)
VKKAEAGRSERINTCIACNQACLDHVFENQHATCLLNPRACNETELVVTKAPARKSVAVVGAGPAGLASATTLAERGHAVTLFDAAKEIGGQFNMAKRIPGKEEFHESLRYFRYRIEDTGVTLRLNTRATAQSLRGFDSIVLATGVTPRALKIPGAEHPKAKLSRCGAARQAGRRARCHHRRRRDWLRRRRIPHPSGAFAVHRRCALVA